MLLYFGSLNTSCVCLYPSSHLYKYLISFLIKNFKVVVSILFYVSFRYTGEWLDIYIINEVISLISLVSTWLYYWLYCLRCTLHPMTILFLPICTFNPFTFSPSVGDGEGWRHCRVWVLNKATLDGLHLQGRSSQQQQQPRPAGVKQEIDNRKLQLYTL